MSRAIADYALLGDGYSACLVSRDGRIDWFCVPRFDSQACFAALLGDDDNGYFALGPSVQGGTAHTERSYRPGTMVLETEHRTPQGRARVIDFMPRDTRYADIVRVVDGLEGRVPFELVCAPRFDYGKTIPWLRRNGRGAQFLAGDESLQLDSTVNITAEHDGVARARFTVGAGEQQAFSLSWHASHEPCPPRWDAAEQLAHTTDSWRAWLDKSSYRGEYRSAVERSLLTLKTLIYQPTGGIIAAPTMSLPERVGGSRNWDYRFCWLRDATFTLYALLNAGYVAEATAWRDWLLRAVAGRGEQVQPLYRVDGSRLIFEHDLGWLSGYAASRPVREGNAAFAQAQHDIFGEVMDAMFVGRRHGMPFDEDAWRLQCALLEHLERSWGQPDAGIWEMRQRPQHFVHSKVMAWVAFDRAVKSVERFHLEGPVGRWRAARDAIHSEVLKHGVDRDGGYLTQSYGSPQVDAALLLVPIVGFLPIDDPRVQRTIEAVLPALVRDGLVYRYDTRGGVDGLAPGEGAFLPCSFWLTDCLSLSARHDEARRRFEALLELRNDVGLLAEEYHPDVGLIGNFPQAYSHVALVNSALLLQSHTGASGDRARQ